MLELDLKEHSYLNLFGADRGRCNRCDITKCPNYRGSYNV